MKRSPSFGDLSNGTRSGNYPSRAVHTDLHIGSNSRPPPQNSTPSQFNPIPGEWPTQVNPVYQTKPSPRRHTQHSSGDWLPPPEFNARPPQTRPSPFNPPEEPEADFIDMPDPDNLPLPTFTPQPPTPQPYIYTDDRRRPSPQPSPYHRPLDTLPSSLHAGLPRVESPPLPPKVPLSYNDNAPYRHSPPPPLPSRNSDPGYRPQTGTLTPPRQTTSPMIALHQTGDLYYGDNVRPSPPLRPHSGSRLTPEMSYSVPPRRSSHGDHRPSDPAPLFIAPNQGPPSVHSYSSISTFETTPPRPERYSPRPSPPQDPGYATPSSRYSPSQRPPAKYSPPQVDAYIRPSPQVQSQLPPPLPAVDPYRRPSPQPPILKPTWQPTPPRPRTPAGPITSNPPANSLTDLKHLPFPPIRQPDYHRETLDHPQYFARTNLLKLLVVPAEDTTFVGGGEIYGRLDIHSKGEGGSKGKVELLIGEIGIELLGYDESKAEGNPPRAHIFLQSRNVFQRPYDPSLPTDKMTSTIAYPVVIQPDDKGYRAPAKGTTIFPFRFVLPDDAGSSVEVGSEVRTRYTLTAYARVRLLGSFETVINSVEVDVVTKLPYDHIYRNPDYKFEELRVKNMTEKSFRGKMLGVEASIPKNWWKAGETISITIVLTPTGYKKVGWIKAILVNRVTVKGKAGESKEVVMDHAVTDVRQEEDTDFNPEKPNCTVNLDLFIPKTCRTVHTSLFEVRQYIKIFILHNVLSTPMTLSIPMFDVVNPISLDDTTTDGESYANLITGGYVVREIETKSGSGNLINERPGTNRAVGWLYYVDKPGRNQIC